MKVLIVGAGVIGTVYGAHLAAAENAVSFLSHGPRTDNVAAEGLCVRDKLEGGQLNVPVSVVPHADGTYDVVLVAVRRDQLAAASAALTQLGGSPAIVLFGNNPAGRSAVPGTIPGDVYLGFPGIGGILVNGTATYVRIRQQPTALQQTTDRRVATLESTLSGCGFEMQRVEDMDGWLTYHAAFVACVAAALYRCGTDPVRLSADHKTLTLMCRAITQSFEALRKTGTAGLPRNLAVLHSRWLTAVAVRYWARTMRSPMGELCFAGHARHSEAEMRTLGHDVEGRTPDSLPSASCSGSVIRAHDSRAVPLPRRPCSAGRGPRRGRAAPEESKLGHKETALTMCDHTDKPVTEVTYSYLGDGRNNTANSLLVMPITSTRTSGCRWECQKTSVTNASTGEAPDSDIQEAHIVEAVAALAPLAFDHELVISHGNGPQVGVLALESARDPALSHPIPLDVIGAQTQGMIGYWLLRCG